jgi:hypothetical protein
MMPLPSDTPIKATSPSVLSVFSEQHPVITKACTRCDKTVIKFRAILRQLISGGISMHEVILKRFETPDEVITFDKGRFEKVTLGDMTIGRATYEPGWKWSIHIGAKIGATLCEVEHVGLVVSGRATAAMKDGSVIEMQAGDLFYIPSGHDSWVIGDENYVSLHFLGAEKYTESLGLTRNAAKEC